MAHYVTIKKAAEELGFEVEELTTLVLCLPGAPRHMSRGRLLVDLDALPEFLASHGIGIPADYATNPDEESEDEDEEEEQYDDEDDADDEDD